MLDLETAVDHAFLNERDDAYRLSPTTSQLSVAPWPGVAATGTTPTGARTVEPGPTTYGTAASRYAGDAPDESFAIVEQPTHGSRSATDHGFSDMGRDELVAPIGQRFGTRTRLMSIAAGVVMIAGILSARAYVTGANDEPATAAGSVSLANANVPVVPVAVTPPTPRPGETGDPLSMVRLAPDQRTERETRRANAEGEPATASEMRERAPAIAPRAPQIDLERTLKGVDIAVKAIDQRTKAVTDSASAIRLQAPTFKKVKLAEP